MFQAYDAELERLAQMETFRLGDDDFVVVENQVTSSEGHCHLLFYLLYLFKVFITCIFLCLSLSLWLFVYFLFIPLCVFLFFFLSKLL